MHYVSRRSQCKFGKMYSLSAVWLEVADGHGECLGGGER